MLLLQVFHTMSSWCVCVCVCVYWSFSNSKASQISRRLPRCRANFSSAVVWIVSILPLIFILTSFFPGSWKLLQEPNCNWNQSHHHVPYFFFSSMIMSKYLSCFSSFAFILQHPDDKCFFFKFLLKLCIMALIEWSVRISKSLRFILFASLHISN